jgi:Mn-dependent DtxR family transcriptional regulator
MEEKIREALSSDNLSRSAKLLYVYMLVTPESEKMSNKQLAAAIRVNRRYITDYLNQLEQEGFIYPRIRVK